MDELGQTADQTQPVWNLLDRRDPAWKALYSLYSPDAGRAAGLQYSQQNRQAVQREVAARAAAAAAAAAAGRAAEQQQPKHRTPSPQKTKVAVPHFRQQPQDVPDPLGAVPRRRSGQAIQAAMQEEAQQAWRQAPQPTGRLIDEQEKQRCALLMQFKGSIPGAPAQLTAAGRAKVAAAQARAPVVLPTASSSSTCSDVGADDATSRLVQHRSALQRRFAEAEQELGEREVFVAAMQQLGQQMQPDAMTAMRAEAAAKVQEMRQLHEQIRALDARLR